MGLLEVLKLQMEEYPVIDANPECSFNDQIRKINALLSHFLHIPHPEDLEDDVWLEKYRQYQWLLETNHLPITINKK